MKTKTNQSWIKLLWAGIIAGLLSGIVKLGWEVMFPPRTPVRDATNPPQQLLQLLGVPSDVTHLTYSFSEHALPWISFIIHYSFSVVIAIIYILLAKKYTKITLGYGALFGIIIWIAFHLIIMPIMQVVPSPFEQPFAEHISELFGHIVWMMVIEMVRRYFYQPDIKY
ncbi:DUF1440 domain-containing protein [Staphylococcus saccharolyticus]|uniref:YagU family protein n=1 Tax=Staphylococcus saccharolyticus TaxID=33028 RepID=UPI00102DB04D|nr:DUF1440 domain-containing protein [Staphylococcus saccharolyticus]MBL7572770.1 DUF1440 domain-containing protein [Staphylococcus saccharolyticus]MBL7584294.1 DUF1440 domain-containing protein [Staphylococcus saccharolyticus]MBL7638387.1 DUF1440 domain-containing protein [Staphylococcus saccharolyticus]QRJ68107.1 DUF1440 domain-containing protein [Staphylococcus saccharolyticus]TAA93309.1 DUF1440 domain-containing protein [Staphylococcus saccharolyticus]